jgi:hypothetical protein
VTDARSWNATFDARADGAQTAASLQRWSEAAD